MRRWLIGLLALLLVAAAAFFLFAPGMIERGTNKIDGKPLLQVGEHAKALHKTLTIVDLHSDSLLWSRDFLKRADHGHMDLPRLAEGNVALQILSSTTKAPKGQNYDANGDDTDIVTSLVIAQLQPVRTWNSLLERSLWHAEKLHRTVAASQGRLMAVATQ
ncbi:MAG: peptidase M19, partial [Sphingopyxis granuli]